MRNCHTALAAFVLLCTCLRGSAAALALNCQVCQLLCVLLQEAIEEIDPKSRLDTVAAASKVVSAANGKKGPCRSPEIWEDTAKKLGLAVEKVLLACRKQLERLEEPMESALGEPSSRDAKLRQKMCLSMGKKSSCNALWTAEEVPVSKRRAMQLKEEAGLREKKASGENGEKARAFFASNRNRVGVKVLPSGLQFKVLDAGVGSAPPALDQKVTVHYRGLLIDCIPQDGPVPCVGGTEFDSTFSCKEGTPSAERKACAKDAPISFTAAQAGTFWLELLPLMREGSRVEAYVPYKLAYGSTDDPNTRPALVGPRSALIFQIELLKVLKTDASVEFKTNSMKTTYRIVSEGEKNATTVDVGDKVTVHATGSVAKTGQKFWSTKDPGQEPFTYTAGGGVIAGWDLGARGMRLGEVRRLQIPAEEGYGANGFPAWGIPGHAELDFELEVLQIRKESDEL